MLEVSVVHVLANMTASNSTHDSWQHRNFCHFCGLCIATAERPKCESTIQLCTLPYETITTSKLSYF